MRSDQRLVHSGDGRRLLDDLRGAVAAPGGRKGTKCSDDRDNKTGSDERSLAREEANDQQNKREQLAKERRMIDSQMQIYEIHFFAASAARRSLASFSACALIGGLYAGIPVTASPMIRLWMSCVPS